MSRKQLSKNRYRKRTNRSRRYAVLAVLLMIVGLAVYVYYSLDRHILPFALVTAEHNLKTTVNNVIYTELQGTLVSRGVTANDFYIRAPESGENLLAVNTVLVNEICNAAARSISEQLSALPPEPVSLPMGMAFGMGTLASAGPRFTVDLPVTGNALADYGSKFEAVGINQVHFEVWMTVTANLRILNPVQSTSFVVTREVSLVDTVISGVVPETYLTIER